MSSVMGLLEKVWVSSHSPTPSRTPAETPAAATPA